MKCSNCYTDTDAVYFDTGKQLVDVCKACWTNRPQIAATAPSQPTLRDMWAMAIFQKKAVWVDTGHEIREAYRAADFAMKVRDEK